MVVQERVNGIRCSVFRLPADDLLIDALDYEVVRGPAVSSGMTG